ncbi:MAG: hypothetical protein ACI8QC_002975 [Planctomycetota bacterium]|jgi:hypothetical protein
MMMMQVLKTLTTRWVTLASMASAAAAVAVFTLSASHDATAGGTNSVGSLPDTADDGTSDQAPARFEPCFYVRGPRDVVQELAVLDSWGNGASYDLVEEQSGLVRREFRGDVYIELSHSTVARGQVEVGILSGIRSPMRFNVSVDGLFTELQSLRMDSKLALPIHEMAQAGLLDNRFEMTTLQLGGGVGSFTLQSSAGILKVFQDQ